MLRITDFSGSESGNIMAEVHPSAIIASGAVLGEGTSVGPYSIIGPNVVIGQNCQIGPHVVIEGFTTLGNDNRVFQFASVGSAPQDLKYKGEQSRLEIGSRNIIREYVTLQPGTAGGGMLSKIGDENLFMVSSHVGHDCRVGDKNVFANGVALAGHVQVGNGVILGGLSAIHQFV
ncbi:MAG: acyl-ACP--UDP-N-acetylglucosamine O-acyltransferase, partial [Bdellovibrionales bacterium]|nr:acyl-ACP--UDP-N-acetylglucosamine O-acyltransferase [Bdellovibrionales bacterium]